MKPKSYSEAGVSIEKGDAFARYIAGLNSPAVSRNIGGFAGGISLDLKGIEDPVMLSSTDGVGTKLLVAMKMERYDTLGIDLVAMCVNDLIVAGVQPQIFPDYIACGSISEDLLHSLMKGIVEGCEQAECLLAGGETAEMPDLYQPGHFDLAGFCTGVGDKSSLLPRLDDIKEGDMLFALPSSGVHSNGLSLARKVLEGSGDEIWQQLLTPTRIYVRDFMPLHKAGFIKAAAHITGGGLAGNIERVLPENLKAELDWNWEVPEIFGHIQKAGEIEDAEMHKVFNMGLGIVMVVDPAKSDELRGFCAHQGVKIIEAGRLTRG